MRDLPDVSFFASNGFLGSAYLICVSATLPTGTTSCTYSPTQEITAEEVGGTSVSSPAMAGVMALINQKAGETQGNPNAELYELASKQTYASCTTETGTVSNSCYFNDIDTGTIAMACQPGTTNCTVAHSGDAVAVLPGFGAGAGYDLATGLGSLNVANVVNAWTSVTGTGTTTVTVTPSATSISASQPLTVTVTVAGSNGVTPAGTVALNGGGYSGTAQALVNGAYTFNVPAFGLTGGSDTLTVTYSGDNNYALSNTTTSVTVSQVAPGAITVAPAASSVAASATLTVTGAVTGAAGGPAPTGTVILSGGGFTSSAIALSSGAYSITIPANSLSVGSDTLTATYSGDGTYLAGTPGTANVTVTSSVGKPAVTITVTPGAASVAFNAPLTVTGTISGSSGTPTGTVTLTSGTYTSSATNLSSGAYSIAIPANSLATGHVALTAAYSGDATYAAGSGTGTVIVTQIAPTGPTVVPGSTTIALNAGLTVTGSITGPSGSPAPTGTVVLSSGSYASSKTDPQRRQLFHRDSRKQLERGHRHPHSDLQRR